MIYIKLKFCYMAKERNISYKLLAFFIIFFVIIAFLGIYGAYHYNPSYETIELEQYCKVSTSDLIKNNSNDHIYFVSWDGSPFGDASSWAIYSLLNESHVSHIKYNCTESSEKFQYNNTPGLILYNNTYNFTYNTHKVTLQTIYLYGENLSNNSHEIKLGLNELKNMVPESIYNEIEIYTTEAIVDGTSNTSANISSIPHINTVTLITGKTGAYLLNGYLLSPSDFEKSNKPLAPEVVMENINGISNRYPSITSAVKTSREGIESTLKDVQ